MRKVTNECVSCGLPCLGDACPNRRVVRWYCDECKQRFDEDELYVVEDEELCADCLTRKFKTVEQAINAGDYDDD